MEMHVGVGHRAGMARRVLQANALFSAASAALFVGGARQVAEVVGLGAPLLWAAMGLGLAAWALWLFQVTQQADLSRGALRVAIVGDLLWVGASALLLMVAWADLTEAGRWAVAIVADLVALLALLEVLALRRMG